MHEDRAAAHAEFRTSDSSTIKVPSRRKCHSVAELKLRMPVVTSAVEAWTRNIGNLDKNHSRGFDCGGLAPTRTRFRDDVVVFALDP